MNRLHGILGRAGVQAYLTANPSNIRYQAGYLADYCYTLTTAKCAYYFTDGRFTIEARRDLGPEWSVVEINPSNAYDVIVGVMDSESACKIGYDSDIMHSEYEFVTALMRGRDSVDLTDTVLSMREVKEAGEIDCIVRAQRIAEAALEELKGYMAVGVTERELSARLDYLMRIKGADGSSFDTIVAFGENSAIAHAKPSDRQLKSGDIILIDFGAKVGGYCSDMTRCYVYGEASEQIADMYDAVLRANVLAIEGIRAGQTGREADSIARDYLTKRGYGGCFTHSLGHGVGVDIHEKPYMSMRSSEVLRVGSVVTVEPGVYIEGVGGIRIEDMIIVGENGNINLTFSDKNLEIITN